MDNLGEPVAYLVVPREVPVYDPSGAPIGHLAEVLADEGADIFHGLIVRLPGIPDQHRFVDPSQLAGIFERGITLTVTADKLHEPSEDAVAAAAVDNESLGEGLRRTWAWLNRPM